MLSGLDELVWEFGNYQRTYRLYIYLSNDADIMNKAENATILRAGGKVMLHVIFIIYLQFSGTAKEEKKGL